MDVKTLRVGQKVVIRSGCYGDVGTVIRVGPLGVDVKTGEGGLFQFNYEGIERDGQSTFEGGIWKIEDLVKACPACVAVEEEITRRGCMGQ